MSTKRIKRNRIFWAAKRCNKRVHRSIIINWGIADCCWDWQGARPARMLAELRRKLYEAPNYFAHGAGHVDGECRDRSWRQEARHGHVRKDQRRLRGGQAGGRKVR